MSKSIKERELILEKIEELNKQATKLSVALMTLEKGKFSEMGDKQEEIMEDFFGDEEKEAWLIRNRLASNRGKREALWWVLNYKYNL